MESIILRIKLPPVKYVCSGYLFNEKCEDYYYSWETADEACRELSWTTLNGSQILNMKKEVVGIVGLGMFYDKDGNWLVKR